MKCDVAVCAVFDDIERYAPGFKTSVVGRDILTPPDLERIFALTGGVNWALTHSYQPPRFRRHNPALRLDVPRIPRNKSEEVQHFWKTGKYNILAAFSIFYLDNAIALATLGILCHNHIVCCMSEPYHCACCMIYVV